VNAPDDPLHGGHELKGAEDQSAADRRVDSGYVYSTSVSEARQAVDYTASDTVCGGRCNFPGTLTNSMETMMNTPQGELHDYIADISSFFHSREQRHALMSSSLFHQPSLASSRDRRRRRQETKTE
jgi:hypothetical protein